MSTAGGTALVLGFGAYRALNGHLTVGELLVVMTYIASVYKPLEAIIYTISSLQQKLVSLEHVFGLMDREPDILDAPGAPSLDRARGEVAFEEVSFTYEGRHQHVLDSVSTSAPARGAGGRRRAHRGRQDHAGEPHPPVLRPPGGPDPAGRQDLSDLRLRSLRDQVSLVLQEPVLFSGTIEENIRYGSARPRGQRGGHGSRPGSQRPGLHRAASQGLRDRAGGAGCPALGGRTAADLHRPGLPEGCPHPDPRRAHLRRGLPDRGHDPGGPRTGSWRGGPPSSSPTACPRSATRTGSWCWMAVASWSSGTHDRAPGAWTDSTTALSPPRWKGTERARSSPACDRGDPQPGRRGNMNQVDPGADRGAG
jgi:hypothetical protein